MKITEVKLGQWFHYAIAPHCHYRKVKPFAVEDRGKCEFIGVDTIDGRLLGPYVLGQFSTYQDVFYVNSH